MNARPTAPQVDPFTGRARLCDNDGTVRRGVMHNGTDYPCTGHAHYARQHIECTNPIHVQRAPAGAFHPGGGQTVVVNPANVVRAAHWSPTIEPLGNTPT